MTTPSFPAIRQAAILVGGLGSRLGAVTAATPKPVLACGDRPFLAWMIRELLRFGVQEVVLLAGHLSEALSAVLPAIEASLPRRVSISCSIEPVRAGTGGALVHARDRLERRFLLLNGDSILDFNLTRLLAAGTDGPAITLRPVGDTDRFGVVQVAGPLVTTFSARAEQCGPGLVNAGVYLLERDLLDGFPPVCSLEADILPVLADRGVLRHAIAKGYFVDIGVPADLARAGAELPGRLRRPALLLDRDGTLNHDHGWVGSRDRWDWVTGAREAVAAATEAGWHVFVVTNQSGIARGLYDEAALGALHDWMSLEFRSAGGTVDDVRYCPFHPDASVARYRGMSDWRKPGPGMILDLMRAWELDPKRCVMVGDRATDMEAAAAAGIAGAYFGGGDLRDVVLPLLS